jgi:hypothetical protein
LPVASLYTISGEYPLAEKADSFNANTIKGNIVRTIFPLRLEPLVSKNQIKKITVSAFKTNSAKNKNFAPVSV